MIEITSNNFQSEVVESELPILIDFWAEWCGPCKMMTPIAEQIAQEYAGKIKVASINIENEQGLAARYEVFSIPQFITLHPGGEEHKRAVGSQPKTKLVEAIDLKSLV